MATVDTDYRDNGWGYTTMMSIARLESFKLWRHPICWGLLLISVMLLTLLFYRLCVDYLRIAHETVAHGGGLLSLSTEVLKPLCSWSIVILAIFLPLFTTYAFSQESKYKTRYLWATGAFSAKDIVIGKFLSILSIVVLLSSYMLLLVSTLALETSLNWGNVLTAWLAVVLIGSCFISFGLFVSCLVSGPLLAAGASLLGNLFWMLLEWLDPFPANPFALSQAFSLLNHSYYLLNGLIYTQDIVYFGLFTVFWLVLTQQVIRKQWVHC